MNFYSLPTTAKISYISTSSSNEAQLFIIRPDGLLYQLFPQGTTTIDQNIQMIETEV
jgi:hypothetical protein